MASKPNAKICSLCDLFHVIACVIFGVISFNFLLVVRNFVKVIFVHWLFCTPDQSVDMWAFEYGGPEGGAGMG